MALILFTTTILALLLYVIILCLLFTQKPRKFSFLHSVFIAFILSFVIWTIFNFLSVTTSNQDLFLLWVKVQMTGVILQGILFDIFVTNHPYKSGVIATKKWFFVAIILLSSLIVVWSSLLFESSTIQAGLLIPIPGQAPFIFPLLMIFLYADTAIVIVKKVSDPVTEKQAKYLGLAHLLFFFLGFGLMFIPTVLFHSRVFTPFSPLFALPVALISLLTLLKFRLLDKQYFISTENIPGIVENRIKNFWGDTSIRRKWDVGQILFPPHKKFLKMVQEEILNVLAEEGITDTDLFGMMIAFSPEANKNYLTHSFGSLEKKKFENVGNEFTKLQFSVVKKDDVIIFIDLKGQETFSSEVDQKLQKVLPYKVLSLLSKPIL